MIGNNSDKVNNTHKSLTHHIQIVHVDGSLKKIPWCLLFTAIGPA